MTNNDRWVRCPKCGHKLFHVMQDMTESTDDVRLQIEHKCHSCKAICRITFTQDGIYTGNSIE